MIDLRLNKRRLRDHFQTYKGQYAISLILAGLAASLLFSLTTPKVPYDKRVDVVIYSQNASSFEVDKWQADLAAQLPEDQEVSVILSPMLGGVQMSQILVARLSAGDEGTIWILPQDIYQMVASLEAFLPLEDRLDDFDLPEGIDLSAGIATITDSEDDPGVEVLCGIPLDSFKGLATLFDPTDMVLAMPHYVESNYDNAIITANWLFSKQELK